MDKIGNKCVNVPYVKEKLLIVLKNMSYVLILCMPVGLLYVLKKVFKMGHGGTKMDGDDTYTMREEVITVLRKG